MRLRPVRALASSAVASSSAPADAVAWPPASSRDRVVACIESFRWPVLVYLGSRALVLVVAVVEGFVNHRSLMLELTNWDGQWYAKLAYSGYPAHPPGASASTLGFFPLYPLVVRRLAGVLAHLAGTYDFMSLIYLSGLIISGVGGLVTAVLVQRLATGWWGEAAGRRAVAIFCLFPGSVVFSMAYAEGLMLPLVAACILALQKRRWLLAGILAGLATATEPEGVVLIAVCGVAALQELYNRVVYVHDPSCAPAVRR